MAEDTFIMDVGAYSLKAGFVSQQIPDLIFNCKMKVKSERQRQYIGDQIDECKDYAGLYYILSHQKGFILNWDIQREIWEYTFKTKYKSLIPKEVNLIMTEPYFNFKTIQNNIDEIMFEEYGFKSVLRTNCGYLSSLKQNSDKTCISTDGPDQKEISTLACLVVDSGFSFTHIAPYVYCEKTGFKKLKQGIRRIDVGGKVLTNHLKEIISYRQMNVMDETYVINQCKEDVCFVSTDFDSDLEICEKNKFNNIARDYILPDYTNYKRGYVREPDWRDPNKSLNSTEPQFVRLANERFQVPELLFHPSDVGINQVGIVEAIVESINSVPKKARPLLYANIVLTGGNVKIPGFKERVEKGIRAYCPNQFQVFVHSSKDPITHAWYGGKVLASDHAHLLSPQMITKKDYEESGENKRTVCVEKFDT